MTGVVTTGDLAYLDTFSGLVPVKVLKVEEVEDTHLDTMTLCTVQVTAPRRGYTRGEVIDRQRPGFSVVTRDQIRRTRYATYIVGDTVAIPDPITKEG